jgi:4-amino-4-deoxy-L-arabinose transferase-like glycosyltransferase
VDIVARVAGLRRVPTPLLVLLAVCLVEALAWCIVLPPLQGPDEISHVAYVQKIGEAREIPWSIHGKPGDGGLPYSTELGQAEFLTGVAPLYGNPSARPAGTRLDERLWNQEEARLGHGERSNGGFTSALKNPPAYYLYEAVPYLVTSPLGIFDQIFVLRLANIPFLLITVLFVWLVAGELLGRRRWLQTLATGAVALQPQLTHMTAVVNPDVCLAAIWSAALYLMIVILRRGLTARRTAGLLALCAASGLTHGRGVALVLPALLTLGLAVWKARRPGRRPTRRQALTATVIAASVGVLLFVYVALSGNVTTSGVRQLGSYQWQFYLPHPAWLTPFGPDYGLREVVVERFYGAFAQLEVGFSPTVDDAIWWGMIAVAASAAVAIYRNRASLRESWDVAVVLVVTLVGMLLLLHAVAYRSIAGGSGDPIITGRYVLPLMAGYGTAIGLAVSWLPRRVGVGVGGALLALLVLLQLGALGITVERFYA